MAYSPAMSPRARDLCLFLLLCCLLTAQAANASGHAAVDFQANPSEAYAPGETDSITVSLRLIDEGAAVDHAVAFLNVVAIDEAGRYPQRAHVLFAAAEESPTIFRVVKSGSELEAGLRTTVSFTFREDAAPGVYAFVLQVFEGRNTNPNRVRLQDRLGIQSYRFELHPE